ncbi:MAG: myo-inosose-2 dehydratase [Clostridiales bacterium]|jgi:inosose dehydratase|nr:myo-inosose-2 dehydratase [Clostridiales bacterium]
MLNKEKIKLGIAPIGWTNDDMPALGGENTFEQCISEMALAGFTGCEVGNKYPKDTKVLKEALDLRGMRIASKWFSSFLATKPYEETEAEFIKELDYLEAVGADRINVSEQSYSVQGNEDLSIFDHKVYFTDEEWDKLCEGLNKLGKIAKDRGFKLCFHHHMGTGVQTIEETRRLMDNTDKDTVFLCYDTGHFTFSGEDPLTILREYPDRIGHVHLKDVRADVLKQATQEKWSFLKSVREGTFTVPGDGCVDFESVFKELDKMGYEGWLLVEAEQDPAKANPFKYAKMAREYIRSMIQI